ncbi:MAG: SPOR domain-containing protein [Pseudomonadota bacterium]
MGLLSFFQRPTDAAADAPAAEPDAVAAARTRARRRLIGAAVLLGIGVVGFPLLFETQPRPVPVNIPIEIPRKEGAPPLAPPGPSPALSAASAAVVLPDAEAPAVATRPAEITERADDAGREIPPPVVSAQAAAPGREAASAAVPAKPVAAASRPPAAASRPAPTPAPTTTATDGARAQALLDGQAASAAAAGRMVVQVGAYTEPAKLKDARQKVEKLGFKTYTQVVEVDGSKRTRVRVGPFATKAEADKAAARIKASGLPVAILTL